jgi:sugar phosphate isomerase/epimerase
MSSIPVALQLWSLRDLTKTDFAGTVAAVAKIGYAGVETAGFGNLDVAGVSVALKSAGLTCAGMHVGIGALRTDLNRCVSEALLLGARHVICPGWPRDHYHSGAACARLGEELGAIGATFRAHGIQFAFHNHAAELAVVDGRRVFDWMLDAAAPRDLGCQADVYWVQVGGKDPAAFIREQGRRIRTLHLKDEAELGGGPVDFTAVFAAAEGIGAVEWYVVEVEQYNFDPLESVRRSFNQLRTWGRA